MNGTTITHPTGHLAYDLSQLAMRDDAKRKAASNWVLLEDEGNVGQMTILKAGETPHGFLEEIQKGQKKLEHLLLQCSNGTGTRIQSEPLHKTIIARYFKLKAAATTETEREKIISEILNANPEEFLALLADDEMSIWKSIPLHQP